MSLSIKAMKLSHRVTKSPSRDVTYYTDENKHDVIGASFMVMELWSCGVGKYSITS
ncbi:MAG: hypothetical protein IJ961_06600 [Bacteroidales bacterium]|nr:hypothetical protein [Bacteroidales bacterium]